MKIICLLIIALLFSIEAIFSKSVEVNSAKQVAQSFYLQTTGNSVALSLAFQCLNTDTTKGLPLNAPIFYVFNVTGDKGFVMVSAEDITRPVLGYNTTGQFIINNAPSAIACWLDKYNRQIIYAKVNNISATKTITDQWNNYYNGIASNNSSRSAPIGPLLNTTWDQDLYYNDLCPLDGESPNIGYGGRCPTGCGATAMAQIMKYWSYPAQGSGTNTDVTNYGNFMVNFGTTGYNWTNMPNSVTSTNTDIANLLYDCGVAVNMMYGTVASGGSGSYMTGAAPSCQAAYTAYFGYDPSAIQALARSENESNWTSLILNELSNGRPIQYDGSGPSGGHTWVLDGTDGNGNFHLNWGWSGADDGYYSLDALDPAPYANGTYSSLETMLIGIQPLNVTPSTADIELYSTITINPNPISFEMPFSVNADLINDGGTNFSGSYCAALFDTTGTFIRYIGPFLSTGTSPLSPGSHYQGGATFADTVFTPTVPGDYTIGIYYQPSGATTWTLAGTDTYNNPISVTISGPVDNVNYISLYSNIVDNPLTFVQYQPASVSVNLTNDGSTTFYGQYEAVLLNLAGDAVEQQIATLTESNGLQPNYSYNSPLVFSTSSITVPEGQYILAIADNASGSSNWWYCGGQTYSNPILVDVVNTGIIAAVNEASVNPLRIYPNPASNSINIEAGDVYGNYTLIIYNTVGQQMTESHGNLEGQKLSADVSSFAMGLYTVQLKTESGVLNSKFMVK